MLWQPRNLLSNAHGLSSSATAPATSADPIAVPSSLVGFRLLLFNFLCHKLLQIANPSRAIG
jgi:hypothetical protein